MGALLRGCPLGLALWTLLASGAALAFDEPAVYAATWEQNVSGGLCGGNDFFLVSSTGSFDVGLETVNCDSNRRAVLEFDLANLPPSFDTVRLSVNAPAGLFGPTTVHGFSGNGIVELADATVDAVLTTLPGASPGVPASVDVTDFVNALLTAGATHAGFTLDRRNEPRTTFDGVGATNEPVLTDQIVMSPIADAGPDQVQDIGAVVMLDGSNSSDPDGDLPLTYSWTLTAPGGSTAALDVPSSATPSFSADRAGVYLAELTVTDAEATSSDPDDVAITIEGEAQIAPLFAATWAMVIGGGTCFPDPEFVHLLSSSGSFEAGLDTVGCDSHKRGVLEFDLAQLPAGDLAIAHLVLEGVSATVTSELSIHAYSGNGQIDVADANVDSVVEIISSPGFSATFDVTTIVNALRDGGASHAGFTIAGGNSGLSRFGGTGANGALLHVVSDPPPAVPSLSGWGLLFVAALLVSVGSRIRRVQARV